MRKKITTSEPRKRNIQSSISIYEKLIENEINAVKNRNEIRMLMDALIISSKEKNIETNSEEKIKISANGVKISPHTQRLIENKLKLENYLKEIEATDNVNNLHLQTHRKLEKNVQEKRPKISLPNMDAIKILALPKILLLKHCISRFSYLMSSDKIGRIKCQFSKSLSKPEEMETVLRRRSVQSTKMVKKPKLYDFTVLRQLFHLSTEANSIIFEDLICFAMMSAMNKVL